MARKLRFKIAGVAQLITQRGINGQAVFFLIKIIFTTLAF
jgi:hypothetical protein